MWDWTNKKVFGIRMSRFGASWLRSGGDINDQEGFLKWMTSIPFEEKGKTVYISEETAIDAFMVMSNGKMELETNAKQFLMNR